MTIPNGSGGGVTIPPTSQSSSNGIGTITGDLTAGPASAPSQSVASTFVGTANVNTVVGGLPAVATNVVRRSATAQASVGETTVFTGATAAQIITAPPSAGYTDLVYRIVNDASVSVTLAGGTNSLSVLGAIVASYVVPAGTAYDFVWDGTGIWQCMAISQNAGAAISPATTVTGPDVFGAAAVVGTGTDYARQDHDHGLPAAPSPSLSYLQSFITADVILTTANTKYNITSLNLGIGTWLLYAQFKLVSSTSVLTENILGVISTTSASFTGSLVGMFLAPATGTAEVKLTEFVLSKIVIMSSATTVYLVGQSSNAGDTISSTTQVAGDTSGMYALKIA